VLGPIRLNAQCERMVPVEAVLVSHEGTFQSVDGLSLFYRCWEPEGSPRAMVIICHGVADHGERYVNLVRELVAAGYVVYAHDHRGHGRSPGRPLHVDRFQQFVDDLEQFCAHCRAIHPDLERYLFAHSMGSAIGLAYVIQHPSHFAGMVSSGTALYAGEGFPPLVLKLNQWLSSILPLLRLTQLPTDGISRDDEWVRQTKADPLVYHGPGTARLGAEILNTLNALRPRLSEIRIPLLIVHGGADILVEVKGAQLLHDTCSSDDSTLRIYDGAYHELFNEPSPVRERAIADIISWLDIHCPSNGNEPADQ